MEDDQPRPAARQGRLNTYALRRLLLGETRTRTLVRSALQAALVGLAAGLGAVVFSAMVDFTSTSLLGHLAHYVPPHAAGETNFAGDIHGLGPVRPWMIALLPALGGLLVGLLVYTLAPEAEGHGTDSVIDAFHNKQGRIAGKVPIVKMIASALTIGSGGSAGREGPITQIGAGFGSVLGRWLRLPPAQVRLLVVIGCGAGIGATFRAPLGAALFAASVFYRETDYEHEALMPSFIASVVAYSIFMMLSGAGQEPIFALHPGLSFRIAQLPLFALLGLAMVPLSFLYIWMVYGLRDYFFRRLPLPRHVVPAVGGLLVGLIALKYPQVLGVGYGWIQEAMDGRIAIGLMLIVALLKIVATGLTIGSGGSGGVFAPAHVIGGLAGGAMGLALQRGLGTAWVPSPEAYVLIGMAAFFAAAGKVPIASLVLVTEMSGSYVLLIPAMCAISLAYMFSGTRWSIFESQVRNRYASPAHRGRYVVDILAEIPVRKVFRPAGQVETVRPETTLSDLYGLIGRTRQSIFPVTEGPDRYMGMVSLSLLREVPQDLQTANLIIAEDLLANGTHVHPTDNLDAAMDVLLRMEQEEIPVLDAQDRFCGLLCRRDVLGAYYQRLNELRSA
jgi:chloride channel protein, CIC family